MQYVQVCVCACFCVSVLAVALLDHHAGHALDAVSSVVFVVSLPGHVLQILHVRTDEHIPQLHKVTVGRVLHCKTKREGKSAGTEARDENTHSSFSLYFNETYIQPYSVFTGLQTSVATNQLHCDGKKGTGLPSTMPQG